MVAVRLLLGTVLVSICQRVHIRASVHECMCVCVSTNTWETSRVGRLVSVSCRFRLVCRTSSSNGV